MKSKYTKYIIIPFFTILTMQYLLAQNPIIRHVRTADPSAHIWDDKGTLWIYTSGDPNDGCSDYSTMDGYRAFSTTDMVNYTDHGVILHSKDISWGVPGYMFAPTFAYKNGKYYCIYPHAYENSYAKFNCGVAVSDVPQGPFTDIGIIEGVSGQWIDPCVFTDTDGTSYLYWGINEPKVAKLKDNMTELAEEPRVIEYGSDNFFEAIYMHKKDDIYYFSYNTGKGGYYAMGDNPYGPFEYKGAVNPAQMQDHHSMIEFKGQWYFFYHVDNYNGGSGCMRNTCAEYLFYNTNGTLKEIYPSIEGVSHVDAPVISFTSPTYNQKFEAPASVLVDVDATDNQGISNVMLFLNGALVSQKKKAPYTWGKDDSLFDRMVPGQNTLKVVAIDNNGRIGEKSRSVIMKSKSRIHDEQGRQIIPRGFVVNTEDKQGDLFFNSDDYYRMVKNGANFQVIRLRLGSLGGYPNNPLNENYLMHLDTLVQLGKNAGIRTDFKMTVYGTKGFEWGDFWRNENNEIGLLENAWKMIFERYKDEPYVYGYDLWNEPRKGDFKLSYEKLESEHLIPLIQRLINTCHQVNADKKCLYQPILVNDEDRKDYSPPFIKMKTPVKGDNVFYAPHIYEGKKEKIRSWIKQYEKDAQVSNKPIFIGEWGNATFNHVDSTLTAQHTYEDFYVETTTIFDSLMVGSIKAWFKGTREIMTNPDGTYTWSLFKDASGSGSIERKYIMDIIARPYPQCIAGELTSFSVDFPTRTMTATIIGDNSKGASKIFIPADRWYPDGFTVTIGETVVKFNPMKNIGIEVVEPGSAKTTADIIWDPFKQQLMILQWPEENKKIEVLVQPGLYQKVFGR